MMKIQNFIKIYERSFIENWDLPALSEYGKNNTITYGEFATSIAQIHMLFESLGLKPGDKVALCGKDSVEWVRAYMATVTYGGVIVPILPEFNPLDVTHIVNHSEARLFIVSDNIWEHIEPESLLNVSGVLSLETRNVFMRPPTQNCKDI